MTEREQLIVWLDTVYVPYWTSANKVLVGNPYFGPEEGWTEHQGVKDRVTGYASFFTEFVFDDDGILLEMGAWE